MTALGIVVILTGLVLVFAQGMRTEALATANRLSYLQADAIEQGAERWVLAQVESNGGDAVAVTQLSAEAVAVGDGYFWILRPDPDQSQNYAFGITDESAKLNLNTATSAQTQLLPGMTADVADAIVDWVDADSNPSASGAESSYYSSLPEPYSCKNAPMETVEELLLVKGVTNDLLFGSDRNRDGVLDATESGGGSGFGANANNLAAMFNSSASDGRGLFNFVTVYTVEPNTTASGADRVNVNDRDTSNLRRGLRDGISAARADAIIALITPRVRPRGGGAGGRPAFENLGAFYSASGMTVDEFKKVVDQLTTNSAKTLSGMINVNTAPRQVLACLPGLDQGDVDSLVNKRSGADTSNIGWIFEALPASKASTITGAITARSHQYSADIVAVSGDGRAYKRVRIVIDSRQTPGKMVYRRDLTSLGWPLDPQIRATLRSGKTLSTNITLGAQ